MATASNEELPQGQRHEKVTELMDLVARNPGLVEVSGLEGKDGDILSDEYLMMCLESPRVCNGGLMKKIFVSPTHKVALIIFEDAKVAQRLLEGRYYFTNDRLLTVSRPTGHLWDINNCAVTIEGIPSLPNLSRESLEKKLAQLFGSVKYRTDTIPVIQDFRFIEGTQILIVFEDFIDALHVTQSVSGKTIQIGGFDGHLKGPVDPSAVGVMTETEESEEELEDSDSKDDTDPVEEAEVVEPRPQLPRGRNKTFASGKCGLEASMNQGRRVMGNAGGNLALLQRRATTDSRTAGSQPGSGQANRPITGSGSCVHCDTIGSYRCKKCKAYYCSPDCQRSDWPQHKNICSQKKSGRVSDNESNKEKDNTMEILFKVSADEDLGNSLDSSVSAGSTGSQNEIQMATLNVNPAADVSTQQTSVVMCKLKKAANNPSVSAEQAQSQAMELGFGVTVRDAQDGRSFILKGLSDEVAQIITWIKRQWQKTRNVEAPSAEMTASVSPTIICKLKKAANNPSVSAEQAQSQAMEFGFGVTVCDTEDGKSFLLKGKPEEVTQMITWIKRQWQKTRNVEAPSAEMSASVSSTKDDCQTVKLDKSSVEASMTTKYLGGLAKELGFDIVVHESADGKSFQLKGQSVEINQLIACIQSQSLKMDTGEAPSDEMSSSASSANADLKPQEHLPRTVTSPKVAESNSFDFLETTLPNGTKIYIYRYDITKIKVDVIVNAANGFMNHGGGVAAAIAWAAGEELITEGYKKVRNKGGEIEVTQNISTTGGRLCWKVIHAVGPQVIEHGQDNCKGLVTGTVLNALKEFHNLRSCYRPAAGSPGISSIAIPAISSGVYGVPVLDVAFATQEAILIYDEKLAVPSSPTIVHLVNILPETTRTFIEVFRGKHGTGRETETANNWRMNETSQGKDEASKSLGTFYRPRRFQSYPATGASNLGSDVDKDWSETQLLARKNSEGADRDARNENIKLHTSRNMDFAGDIGAGDSRDKMPEQGNLPKLLTTRNVELQGETGVQNAMDMTPEQGSSTKLLTSRNVDLPGEKDGLEKMSIEEQGSVTLRTSRESSLPENVTEDGDVGKTMGSQDAFSFAGIASPVDTNLQGRMNKDADIKSQKMGGNEYSSGLEAGKYSPGTDEVTKLLERCDKCFSWIRDNKTVVVNAVGTEVYQILKTRYKVVNNLISKNQIQDASKVLAKVEEFVEKIKPQKVRADENSTSSPNRKQLRIDREEASNDARSGASADAKKTSSSNLGARNNPEFQNDRSFEAEKDNPGPDEAAKLLGKCFSGFLWIEANKKIIDEFNPKMYSSLEEKYVKVKNLVKENKIKEALLAFDDVAGWLDTVKPSVEARKASLSSSLTPEKSNQDFKKLSTQENSQEEPMDTSENNMDVASNSSDSFERLDYESGIYNGSNPYISEDEESSKGASAKGAKTEAEEKDECSICLSEITDPKILGACKHVFCKPCIEESFKKCGPKCPNCGAFYGEMEGTQPGNGKMTVTRQSGRLPGYDRHTTIVIHYSFPNGIQESCHPNPGQPYSGTNRTAYLPDNWEGRKVEKLLRRAFGARLVFTVGQSATTGRTDTVVWNNIHHKTNMHGGPQKYGYPDPTYLTRVQEELAAFGIK